MPDYRIPLQDIQFALDYIAEYAAIAALPGRAEATDELARSVLDEAAKFAESLLAPYNKSGDEQGVILGNHQVQTQEGFREAYEQYVDAGWASLPFPQQYGGQDLPWILGSIVQEMWDGANMAWGLCAILSRGAIECLLAHGSDEQKDRYLPKMVSGEWSGTMNLTEAQAGTDLGAIRTMAVDEGDHYRIRGQKIFITWGEQDFTENIIHLVLARTEGAPAGTRGVSLFIVPKYLVNEDGTLGERNDVKCVSVEEKLGIHASATCVMAYGEDAGAIGYRVGDVGKGIANMFTMMNNERLAVSLQSIAVAERSYQLARSYAKERVQSRSVDPDDGKAAVSIIHHADVRRMLLSMKSRVEAGRALCYYAMAQIDVKNAHDNEEIASAAHRRVDLLTPIVKGWCTETAFDVANLGVQVHGGMGFIEETGAAQFLRDTRITSIYEGTTGIQSNDLVSRKVLGDGGKEMNGLIREISTDLEEWRNTASESNLPLICERLGDGLRVLEEVTGWILEQGPQDANRVLSSAYHYLMLSGYVTAGWLMTRGIVNAERAGVDSEQIMIRSTVARYLCDQFLSHSSGLATTIKQGSDTVMALSIDQF